MTEFDTERLVEDAIKNPYDMTMAELWDAAKDVRVFDRGLLLASLASQAVARLERRVETLENRLDAVARSAARGENAWVMQQPMITRR